MLLDDGDGTGTRRRSQSRCLPSGLNVGVWITWSTDGLADEIDTPRQAATQAKGAAVSTAHGPVHQGAVFLGVGTVERYPECDQAVLLAAA